MEIESLDKVIHERAANVRLEIWPTDVREEGWYRIRENSEICTLVRESTNVCLVLSRAMLGAGPSPRDQISWKRGNVKGRSFHNLVPAMFRGDRQAYGKSHDKPSDDCSLEARKPVKENECYEPSPRHQAYPPTGRPYLAATTWL